MKNSDPKTSKCCICGKRKIRATEMYVYYQGRMWEKALMACLAHKDEKPALPNVPTLITR